MSSNKKKTERHFIFEEEVGYSKRYLNKLSNSNEIKLVKVSNNIPRKSRKFSISDIPKPDDVERYISDKRRAFVVLASAE